MGSVSFPTSQRRRSGAGILALCWVSGLAFGIAVYAGAEESLSSLMRNAADGTVPIVSLLYAAALPFLITAFAVFLSHPVGLLVCFGKAFLFSFAAMGITRAFGGAGWLYCRLVLFSDWAMLPLLYYLWLRMECGQLRRAEFFVILALAILTVSVDYRIVSSVWASLIEIQKGLMG